MTEFKKKYCEYFIQVISMYLSKAPSVDLVYDWLFDYVPAIGESDIDLQVFVVNNTKKEFDWMTGIGLLDGCRMMVEEALSNGNILTIQEYGNRRFSGKSDECDCQDYDNGLASNYCPVHNENPFKKEG